MLNSYPASHGPQPPGAWLTYTICTAYANADACAFANVRAAAFANDSQTRFPAPSPPPTPTPTPPPTPILRGTNED